MIKHELKTYNCVVRLQRKQEPEKFQVRTYTVAGAAEKIRFKYRLRGEDPHRGFEITEVV